MARWRLRCGIRYSVFCALGRVELGQLDHIHYWGYGVSRIIDRGSFGISIKGTRNVRCPDYKEVSPRNGYYLLYLQFVVVLVCQLYRASYFRHCTGTIAPHSGVPRRLYSELRADFYPMEIV